MNKKTKFRTPFWIKKNFFTSFSVDFYVFSVFALGFFLLGSIAYIYIQSLSSIRGFEYDKLVKENEKLREQSEELDKEIARLSSLQRVEKYIEKNQKYDPVENPYILIKDDQDPIFLPEKE